MKRLIIARIVVTFIGIAVWGYGTAMDVPRARVAGMVILAFAVLMRFMPRRWLEDEA